MTKAECLYEMKLINAIMDEHEEKIQNLKNIFHIAGYVAYMRLRSDKHVFKLLCKREEILDEIGKLQKENIMYATRFKYLTEIFDELEEP